MTKLLLSHEDFKLEDPLGNPFELLAELIQGGFDVPPGLEQFRPPPEPEYKPDPLWDEIIEY